MTKSTTFEAAAIYAPYIPLNITERAGPELIQVEPTIFGFRLESFSEFMGIPTGRVQLPTDGACEIMMWAIENCGEFIELTRRHIHYDGKYRKAEYALFEFTETDAVRMKMRWL